MLYILAAILIFGLLIALHELGHFLAAKACGVRVNEYSIGMGPALWKGKKGETVYALRALPVGGYCAMEGEEDASDDPRALSNKGFWAKLFIYAAGAAMNFLTGLVIMLVICSSAAGFYSPTITGFADGCPLQGENGLQVGDKLWAIDGERVYVYNDVSMLFGMGKDNTYDLTILRGGEKVKLNDFTMERREYLDSEGQPYTGFGLFFGVEKATFREKLRESWNSTVNFARLVRMSLKMMVTGEAGLKDMSGPVGIVTVITDVGEQSETVGDAIANIAYLAAMIAVNLAVMNLLPLPALDGGKILFLVLNAIAMALFRRQIPEKYENYVHFAGLILLLGLMAVITFQDVWKLFG